jgi:hypothetical protein
MLETKQLQFNAAHIKGRQVASVFDMRSKQAEKLEQEIQHFISSPSIWKRLNRKVYEDLIAELERLFKIREYVVDNLIATIGRSVLAQRLANTLTYTGIINYGALGSSSTAPANGDTQLTTEVFRKVTASTSYTNNIAFIDFFYAKADTNGTYQEFGTFIDGTGTVNSGKLFTHALTGGWTKSSSESMTVACQYTIT